MKKFLAGLVSLLMLSTAFAEPTITHLGYTAYLGSSNELYLQDPTGTVRVLRYPIADILSITDTVVYCRAQDGKLLSIALDGSQSLIIAEAPTDEQVNALTAKSSYTLTVCCAMAPRLGIRVCLLSVIWRTSRPRPRRMNCCTSNRTRRTPLP